MTPSEFAAKWKGNTRAERAASQEHFIDLCRMLGVETPNQADPTGEWYAFEKGATKQSGSEGWADVWKRNHFGWEYKGKRKDLAAAYQQLLQYREALENPPCLVVCDLDRFEVHTNFTGTKAAVYTFTLDDFKTAPAEPLRILRAVMKEPEALRPTKTRAQITEEAATQFAELAERLRKRGHDPQTVAHFLNRLLFCFFSEDVGVLPKGLVTRMLEATKNSPARLTAQLKTLFALMHDKGGDFGTEAIEWFNGGLFEDDMVLPLEAEDIGPLLAAARLDWSSVEPAILGTLFERGLDPAKRSQLGAHYTDKASILRVIEPVVIAPLRMEFGRLKEAILARIEATRTEARSRYKEFLEGLIKNRPQTAELAVAVLGEFKGNPDAISSLESRGLKPFGAEKISALRKADLLEVHTAFDEVKKSAGRALKAAQAESEKGFQDFLARLRTVSVLDPACGSGNFLYVALQALKDLEKEAILWGSEVLQVTQELPRVGPEVVRGIELNAYAAELARVTIWIGEIQWMVNNGFAFRTNPVLRPLDSVTCRDAILDLSDPAKPKPAGWPEAEFIVGNPPFLGGKRMRSELGDGYVDALFAAWEEVVPREADLVCYWHEAARDQIKKGDARRAGLIATQGIRSGANQRVLKRIKETGDLFLAWSDLDWVVEGANVHISIIGQDDGSEKVRSLDGKHVEVIFADLTGGEASSVDLTKAARLKENSKVAFMGDSKGGKFELTFDEAKKLLEAGPNPNGKPNADVVVPWLGGHDVQGRPRDMYIIDFGVTTPEADASQYEAPYELVKYRVKPKRIKNKRKVYAAKWWIHVEPRTALRKALAPLSRYIVTVRHSPHRLFAWATKPGLPDSALFAFARSDDYAFGVLTSGVHEAWARRKGGQIRVDPRYTPTSTFETFPFPWPLDTPDAALTASQVAHRDAIAAAAKYLDDLRSRWVNPPELTRLEPPLAPGLLPRLLPVDDAANEQLKGRSLTSLYNARPGWLDLAHKALDAAVIAAYGWPPDISEAGMLAQLFALNQARPATVDSAADDEEEEASE